MMLQNKKALVTGSSSGIGEAVVRAFVAQGADVVVNYPPVEKQQQKAQSLVDSLTKEGASVKAIAGDVSSEEQTKTLVTEAMDFLGRIDILVNNAGIASVSTLEQTPVEVWDQTINVHLRGTFLMTQQVLPHMYENNFGKIINTASQLAYIGAPGLCHYTAAKGGIISMTRSLALEIGERKVNVNCVAPGATMTPMVESLPNEVLEAVRQNIPNKRIAEVGDIAPSYVFLASELSSHYQGQVLSPNGGDAFL